MTATGDPTRAITSHERDWIEVPHIPKGKAWLKVIHADPVLHTKDSNNIQELWADFLQAIEKKRRPVCDIEIGHRSTNMSLLGMLSAKAGRSITWDPDKELIIGDTAASALLQRPYRTPWVYPM